MIAKSGKCHAIRLAMELEIRRAWKSTAAISGVTSAHIQTRGMN